MKKIVIATLLVAATTLASAQVEITGKIANYIEKSEKGGATATDVVPEITNFIKFVSKEDLGGGLSARLVVDTSVFADDPKGGANSKIGDRESTVGLANKYGSVDIGNSYVGTFNAIRWTDSYQALYGSIAGDLHSTRGGRFANAVFFKATPTSNLTFNYEKVQNTIAGPEGLGYGTKAVFGPVTFNVARWEQGADKSNVFGAVAQSGSYRFNVLNSLDTTSGVTTRGTSVGLAKKIDSTPITVLTTYGKKTGNAATDINKAYNIGLDYAFSKRTSGQIIYKIVDANLDSLDARYVGVGLIHKF